jgi:hypothetical protein
MVWMLGGCSSKAPGGPMTGGDDDGVTPPGEAPYTLAVDMSKLDRYVTGAPATWPVVGVASASLGLAGVDVETMPASVDGAGAFSQDVPVAAGLQVVPVVARDAKGHARQAHRALISADYLPEGSLARDAASLALTDAVLAGMAGPLTQQAGDIDVAAEIMARDTLSVDDRCTTWPVQATQDATQVALALDGTALWLNVRVPNLYVYFEGECQGLFQTIPIAGEMTMDIDAWTQLSPNPGAACLVGFAHTTPDVQLPGFSFNVWGTAGPLANWLVDIASSGKAQQAHDQFQQEFTQQADTLLGQKLAGLSVFDKHTTMTLLGEPVDVHLCLTGLVPVAGQLVARVGATASAGGTREAPGAPQLGGPSAEPGAKELLLDADMVGQLLFSSWRAGGLHKAGVQQVDFSLISLIAPDLDGMFPDDARVDVDIDGELPPVVSASPVAGADLRIDLGDLMVDLSVQGQHLFRLGARVTLDLDLVPQDGGLGPTVVATTSEVHLLDEIVDAPDAALETAVQSKLADSAAQLVAGAKLVLPEIPGLGAPVGVTPDVGGRFLRIRTQ